MAINKRFASENYVMEQNSIISEQLKFFQNNVVLFTPQTLTEEQKAQVRANIGVVNNATNGNNNISTTTEFIYTYDGDTNSEDLHLLITCTLGIQ